jgi:hypothetical protein
MRIFLLVFLFQASLPVLAQTGKNKEYDFGQRAASFGSIVQDGNNLIVYGDCLENGHNTFGLLWARLDTNGNVLNYKIYNDSLGDTFTQPYPQSFIKLKDNSGFVGVGQFFNRQNGYLAKFDNNGLIAFIKEFPDSLSRVDFYDQVFETKEGFLIAGVKQKLDYLLEVFVMKTDSSGNKIWEKKYETPNRNEGYGSLVEINENESVIGAYTTSLINSPLQQVKNTSKIFAIDSLGNVKWSWESPLSTEELGVGDLFKIPGGNWAYQSAKSVYNAAYNELWRQPKFVIRDSNFNILSDISFGAANSSENSFYHTIQINSGGWLCTGTESVRYPIPPIVPEDQQNAIAGWIVRVGNNSDSLWGRIDTANWSLIRGSENYLYSATELPSGSIAAIGYTNINDGPLSPRSLGWLIKVNKNGCMDTLNCSTVETFSVSSAQVAARISPNPATNTVRINFGDEIKTECQILLLDLTGRIVAMQSVGAGFSQSSLSLEKCQSGMYIVQICEEGRPIAQQKLTVIR